MYSLNYYGTKARIGAWVISHFPKHRIYCEPYSGLAACLMQKHPSPIEVINDLNKDVINLFNVLKDRELRDQLIEKISFTLFSRDEFEIAKEDCDESIEKARRFLVRIQQCYNQSGSTKNPQWEPRTSESRLPRQWPKMPDVILQYANRLASVAIESIPAIQCINRYDADDTLFFIDPPYILKTRKYKTINYAFEMDLQDHMELLDKAQTIQGMAIICGYDYELYNDTLRSWTRIAHPFMRDVIWISPNVTQLSLF